MYLIQRYPDRVPIVLERDPKCTTVPDIDKKKYLVPNDYTVGQFVCIMRNRMRLNNSVAMFVFIDNILPSTSECISHLYYRYKNELDSLLYITYSGENTFGGGGGVIRKTP